MKLEEAKKEVLKDREFAKEYCIPDAMELRMLRVQERLTQEQLAQICGLKQEAISRLENNSSNTSLKTIGRISYALGYRAKLVFEKLI